MVAIEHRQKPTLSTTKVVETSTPTTATTTAATTNSAAISNVIQEDVQQQQPASLALQENQQKTAKQSTTASTTTTTTTTTTTKTKLILQNHHKMSKNELESAELSRRHQEAAAAAIAKSAVSQRGVDIKISNKSNADAGTQELTKKVLKLDLTSQDLDEYSIKSPRSPISARLPHQTSLTSSVDVEDRKTLREALYQGIFHRHRRTIFAVGSFLRMLRSRNSQYNTIRNPSSEGEDTEEVR